MRPRRPERSRAPAASWPRRRRGRARILAVDDDERNLLAISEVLAGAGEVVCARSGEEALRYLLREEFAVILLDVLMPGLDGYETAALIRQREQSRRTPIIFLTAINKEEAHMLRGYDAGAVDFVFKPFDPLILRSKVTVFVDLFEKTREIQEKAAREQRLLEAELKAQAEKLEAEQALLAIRASGRRRSCASLPVCSMSRGSRRRRHRRAFRQRSVERLTGFRSRAVHVRRRLRPEPHPSRRSAWPSSSAARRRETGAYTCEYRWRRADGSYRNFLDQGVVARSSDGARLRSSARCSTSPSGGSSKSR